MTPLQRLATELDPSLLAEAIGFTPDDWQRSVLRSTAPRQMLLCCRQSGKSTTTACLGLHTAITYEDSPVLIVSPSLRQSGELFGKIGTYYRKLGRPIKSVYETRLSVELANGSRIICVPANPDTVVGFSAVKLIIVDEAARVADDVFRAVSPMLAVSRGRMVALSTPKGQRGFFYDQWHRDGSRWEKIKITADQCPRIPADFLADERETMGECHYMQEYFCQFNQDINQYFSTADVMGALSDDEPPIFTREELEALYTDPTSKPIFGGRAVA
jgi:hypothetical protein